MENINYDDLIPNIENTRLKKRKNDIYLSDEFVEILNRYDIDYRKYNSISELIFDIEEVLNSGIESDELEEVSMSIQEFNYYNNTNK